MIKRQIIIKKKPSANPISHYGSLEKPKTTTTTTVIKSNETEIAIANTLNMLFDGMVRGNQLDKKAAEYLITAIKYKTSTEFHNECLNAYEEALKLHESVFSETVVNKITRNLSEIVDRGIEEIKKITQQIILNSPNDEARQ